MEEEGGWRRGGGGGGGLISLPRTVLKKTASKKIIQKFKSAEFTGNAPFFLEQLATTLRDIEIF